MRRFIVAFILLLAIVFIYLKLSELQSIYETIKNSNWIYLGIGILIECLWMLNLAIKFKSMYRVVGLKESGLQMFLITSAANFVNVLGPTGGIGGISVFIDAGRRRNYSTAKVMVVGALYVMYDYAALLCLLTLGIIVLIRRNSLEMSEIIATGIFIVLAIGMTALLILGAKSAKQLGMVLAWVAGIINRLLKPFLHRDYLKKENARQFAWEIAEGIKLVRGKGKELIWPFLFSLNNKALQVCVMAIAFLTVGAPISVGSVIGGVSIANLFVIVSPTPSGIGFVEGIVPFTLKMLQVPWDFCVLITLIYRALTFWLPLLVGVVTFRLINITRKGPPLESHPTIKAESDGGS
jgi:glycosyltransferase 2 family protein